MRDKIRWAMASAILFTVPVAAQETSQEGLEQAVQASEADLAEIADRRESLLMELEALRTQLEASNARVEDKEQTVDELEQQVGTSAQ